jgi:hypothetical protein
MCMQMAGLHAHVPLPRVAFRKPSSRTRLLLSSLSLPPPLPPSLPPFLPPSLPPFLPSSLPPSLLSRTPLSLSVMDGASKKGGSHTQRAASDAQQFAPTQAEHYRLFREKGAQFTCLTRTKVQILTPKDPVSKPLPLTPLPDRAADKQREGQREQEMRKPRNDRIPAIPTGIAFLPAFLPAMPAGNTATGIFCV